MARADTAGTGVSSVGLFRAAVGVFAILLVVIASVLATEWLSRPDVFPVRAVQFEGEFRHVTQAELAAAVEGTVQGNFLWLDLDAVKTRAESLPWVYQAEVRRRWPRDLTVRITEQQLMARWNQSEWVNQGMQAVRVSASDLPSAVPLLEGPVGTQAIAYERFQDFNRLLADTGLQLRKLTLTPRRTWELDLASGFVLVLDRDQPDKKLERFARVYPRTLARASMPIRQVDLRYSNGFSVDWHHTRAAARTRMKAATPVGAANEEG